MMITSQNELGLVTVVITTYNHAHFLDQSIRSVLNQSYQNIEIIVVDDGSSDNTYEVVKKYPSVKYIFQTNQGLSAARNTGIDNSNGNYLVFLDADDYLLDNALLTNVTLLQENGTVAFVSGDHIKVDENNNLTTDYKREVITDKHYCHLLHFNYIAMHATVMFRRWVFEKFRYDTSLKACEDYDIHLKVARSYPILHHSQPLAAYRKHSSNMSGNLPLMIETGLEVMYRQKPYLQSPEEVEWSQRGIIFWKIFYPKKIYSKLRKSGLPTFSKEERADVWALYKYNRKLFYRYLMLLPMTGLKHTMQSKAKPFVLKMASNLGLYKRPIPLKGQVKRGSFNKTYPFSKVFGYDRGGPIDRYFIENFLQQQAAHIKGRVLEIGDNDYTIKFGGANVVQSDILHVDDTNPKATFVGDISNAPQLPDNCFDCIILTQTLHLIYDFKAALQTCYRILKPGGALLLTVPGLTQIDKGEWKNTWFWSFTEASISRLFAEFFPSNGFATKTHGNVLVATSFLYGLGLPEIRKEELDFVDPHYPVIITAIGHKPITI